VNTHAKVTSWRDNAVDGQVGRLTMFEGTFELDRMFPNPYDPECVTVDACFLLPGGGAASVPCFWYEGYDRSLARGWEVLKRNGEGGWKVRYTPRDAGAHSLYLIIHDLASGAKSRYPARGTLEFECIPSPERGFLQVSRRHSAYLEYENGEPYVGIGHNLCGWEWGGTDNRRGTYEYDEWLINLAIHGATMTQFDLCEGDQIEWTPHPDELPFSRDWAGLTRYNQQTAWKMDYRIRRAEELDLYFRFTLLHWEDFDDEPENFPDWGWNRNPYNQANGGPVADVSQFFRSGEAKRIYRKCLRYIVARWGYSKNILAYELWNEVDAEAIIWGGECPDYASNADAIAEWHREMAAYLKAIDPNRAPVTTSHAHSFNGDAIWRLPDIDMSTFHRYTYFNADYNEQQYDTTGSLYRLLRQRWEATDKPVLAGEFALSPGGDIQKDYDAQGLEFHDQLWISVMAGSMGTAMHWTWGSYIHDYDLYYHYRPLAAFVADEDLRRLRPVRERDAGPLSCWMLLGDERALLWIKDRRIHFKSAVPADSERRNERRQIRLEGLAMANGSYAAAYFDTRTGRTIGGHPAAAVTEGNLTLELPSFESDIAVKVMRADEWPVWHSVDIPDAKISSDTRMIGREFHIQAGGTGIGGRSDAFRFVHTSAHGDFSLSARIDAVTNLGERVRAGLMIREGTSPDSPFFYVGVDPRSYVTFGYRAEEGEEAVFSEALKSEPFTYVKLERTSGRVFAYLSPDGRDWGLLGQAELVRLSDREALAGMAVCSKDAITYVQAAFSRVEWQTALSHGQ